METVTAERVVNAAPERVRRAIQNIKAFLLAAGYDEVSVDDGEIYIKNSLGLATIELYLEVDTDATEALRFEQVEGIFESMETTYSIDAEDNGTRVIARTDYALGGIPGTVLDSTLVARQRKREFEKQFAYLEEC